MRFSQALASFFSGPASSLSVMCWAIYWLIVLQPGGASFERGWRKKSLRS